MKSISPLTKWIVAIITLIIVLSIGLYSYYVDHNRPIAVEKPNIYLYPTEEMNLSVAVQPQGMITRSIPEYGQGWHVRATPDGTIDGQYTFLFYEASINTPFTLKEGWVIEKEEFSSRMGAILDQLGLNHQEKQDFLEYWEKRLNWSTEHYAVYLLDRNEIDKALTLTLSEKPQSLLRAFFYFVPADESQQLPEPQIAPFERNGFTVVEWGGISE